MDRDPSATDLGAIGKHTIVLAQKFQGSDAACMSCITTNASRLDDETPNNILGVDPSMSKPLGLEFVDVLLDVGLLQKFDGDDAGFFGLLVLVVVLGGGGIVGDGLDQTRPHCGCGGLQIHKVLLAEAFLHLGEFDSGFGHATPMVLYHKKSPGLSRILGGTQGNF